MAQVVVSNGWVSNNPDFPVKVTSDGGALVQHMIVDNVVSVSGALTLESSYFTIRFDEGATYTYIGYADPGSATSAASWQIKRMTNASGDILFANGASAFTNIWDNRLSLSYS